MKDANTTPEKELTGYPSIDKPWLKYYSEEAINAPLPECTIYEYLWANNKDHLDDVALIYFGRKITYRKLFENIDRAAEAFKSLGVESGDIVAMALPNVPENIYCMYAINKLSAIADMIDIRSKGDVLKDYLNESASKVAVACDLFADNIFAIKSDTCLKNVVVISPFDSIIEPIRTVLKLKSKKINLPKYAMFWTRFIKEGSCAIGEIVGKSHNTACVFHTSGTTGRSKGVMLTNKCFNAMAVMYKYSGMEFSSGDIFMNQVPTFIPYNEILATHLPLSLHMSIKMLPDYQPNKFSKNISKLRPNHVVASPADWNNLLENEKLLASDLSFLKTLASGGDTMVIKNKLQINKLVQERGCHFKIMEGYGMTEIGSAACTNPPQCDIIGSIGIPLPLNSFCIYDNENEIELTYGKTGEICMNGPTVMKGYFNNESETNATLKQHKDGKVWLHSGDLGHMDENGCVYIDGRMKRIIVCYDGMKISPFEVERAILKCSNVQACCVVGKFDKTHNSGKIPVAYIVLLNPDNNSLEEIKAICKSELSEKYLPKTYVLIDELPLTQNGKVDYRELEKMAEGYSGSE